MNIKNLKSNSLALICLLILGSCGNAYQLKLTSPKTIQIHQKLSVTVSESKGSPIDSVRYYIDGKRLVSGSDIVLTDKKLGKHAISATIFYGDKQKKLTNTIHFFNAKKPAIYTYTIVNEYPHDKNAFTQGLEYYNGFLYESTGHKGESSLRKVEIKTGKVLQKIDLDKQFFGEGMTIFNGKVYMLTWQNKKGFVFNLETLEKESEFAYNQSKEGWGLTHNDKFMIKSDGSERLWFLNGETANEDSYIEVYTNDRKVDKLNELEYFNGKIYANKWQKNSIVIINPENGAVVGLANLKGLQKKTGQKGDDHVLNGIAYDAENDRLFVTGKDWNTLFEIKLTKKQ